MGELVLAPPLYADRSARNGTRRRGRVERGVVRAVVAVAACALRVVDDDLLGLETRDSGKPCAQRIDMLGVGPDGQSPFFKFGDATGRTDRAVPDVGPRIGGL